MTKQQQAKQAAQKRIDAVKNKLVQTDKTIKRMQPGPGQPVAPSEKDGGH